MRHTVLQDKSACTGCGACVSICPKGAIAMRADDEGFLYPAVHSELCIECNLCEKRCPAGNTPEENEIHVLGAQHVDADVRAVSSSGGVFTALARDMLAKGGVVFGAAFDTALHVEHIGAFDETELAGMRGSKYVQSDASDAIANAAALLEREIPVLFSGTPCQIAGLLAKVGKHGREHLLTVDFVCHGVPSPGVFSSYIKELEENSGKRVISYTFRDKRNGWKDFSAVATFEDGSEHVGSQRDEPFLYGFLQNLYLRPSCAGCSRLRGKHHASDITIADLWGAQQICAQHDDDTGLSLLIINTPRGKAAVEACTKMLKTFNTDTEQMLRFNPSIEYPAKAHGKRSRFFADFKKQGFRAQHVMKLLAPPSRLERLLRRIAHLPKGALRRAMALFRK